MPSLRNSRQSSQNNEISLDVLCIQEEDGSCTAVGIQYYVVAQGDDFNEAVDNLFKLLLAQYAYDVSNRRQPLADFSEAPSDYKERFQESQLVAGEGFKPSIPVVSGDEKDWSPDIDIASCKFEPCSHLSLAV